MRIVPQAATALTLARLAALATLVLVAFLPSRSLAQDLAGETPPAFVTGDFTTDTHHFDEVAEGVYFVRYQVPMFNSNSMVVVNDEDVLVVDSHITPATARDLIQGIRRATDKPITTLVNTHFHYDHAHGNQAFGPVQIIGHEFTREKMAGAPREEATFQRELASLPMRLEGLQARLDQTTDAEERQGIEMRLALLRDHSEPTQEIEPVPPDTTLNERMTLFRGDREIQLVFCGRAHTGGDLVVYLPQEKIVYTGDMMLGGPSWLGDGHVDEWPATLEKLKSLDAELFLPGHGASFTNRALIDHVQDYYRALWREVVASRSAGKSIEETAAAVDLTRFQDRLPSVSRPGVDPLAVGRIYTLLAARGE